MRRHVKWLVGLLVVVLVLAGAGWLERTRLLAWYYVHRLTTAPDGERKTWVECVASLQEAALPDLLVCLGRDETRARVNAQMALTHLAESCRADPDRLAALGERLADAFATLGPPGQHIVLKLVTRLLEHATETDMATPLSPSLARLLPEAAHIQDQDVRAQALTVAAAVASKAPEERVLEACRELTRVGLTDAQPANRVRALNLAAHARINLLNEAVVRLHDPDVEVRRAAMLAVGPVPEVLATDDLLHWLHDSDLEVRRLCEVALRGRGLGDYHLRLGRLITDAHPQARLKVLDSLRQAHELEPGIWLRRLSHDPVPAVRAAALRTAADQTGVDLSDRLQQMAQNDPSPTIRQLARYYLTCQKPNSRGKPENSSGTLTSTGYLEATHP